MRTSGVAGRVLPALAAAAALVVPAACTENPTAYTGTTLHLEGTVTDRYESGVTVPGTRVDVRVVGVDGSSAWASGVTDDAGGYAVEAPVTCGFGDSAVVVPQVDSTDFLTYVGASDAGQARAACASPAQTLDLTVYQTVFRTPQPVGGSLVPARLSVGMDHSCAVTGSGTWCWGYRSGGLLGDGTTTQSYAGSPQAVSGSHAFVRVAAGYFFTCALDADSLAWCWGADHHGTVGSDATSPGSATPVRSGGTLHFVDVVAGMEDACGLASSGDVYCWGVGWGLGAGTDVQPLGAYITPMRALLPGRAVSISSTWSHTCAVLEGGDAYCWGFSYAGSLGAGETEDHYLTPLKVLGGHPWAMLSAAQAATCGLTTSGDAYCWGRDIGSGRLGQGLPTGDIRSPGPVVGGHTFVTISVGETHACALTTGGEAWCWGTNTEGELGVPLETADVTGTPVPVATSLRFTDVQAGLYYTCAVTTGRKLVCWGVRERLGSGRVLR